ncbi:nuclease-related domain-containing protein [Hydrogenophaga sp. NFH-34]|uniref:nuclease-related domain-containing protein n=1 Tax=Hydrogenophaga sp. NFH-34 TaxID=2744446 RepID=UPI001F2BDDD3|nr:nuclease-related domain-containing protein [Hydrogenophaga sp. NFH-34]
MRNDNEPCLASESEMQAHNQLKEIFERACPGCRVLTNVIIRTGLDISAGSATAEYDVIVVWKYGLVHFEVKGWRGSYLFSETDHHGQSRWYMRFNDEVKPDERSNALKQCVGKTRLLREQLGIWTQHYVLFTHPDLEVAPDMSVYLVTSKEVTMLPRLIRQKHKDVCEKFIDQRMIDAIADVLLEAGAGLTPEMHLANVMAYVNARKQRETAKLSDSSSLSPTPHEKSELLKTRDQSRQKDRADAAFLLSRAVCRNPVDELLGQYPHMGLTQAAWHMSPRYALNTCLLATA